jgi:hypothetical protein
MSKFQRWIDADGLMKRWEIGPLDLADYVLNSDLTAYYSDKTPYDIKFEFMTRGEWMTYWEEHPDEEIPEFSVAFGGYPKQIPLENKIKHLIFKFEEVVSLEKNIESLHGKEIEQEIKLRPDQRHKEECRAIAKKIWEKNPEMTIVDMIKTKEIDEIRKYKKKPYTDKTLRNWIKNLCPDRSKGRRPASKKFQP